MLKKISSEEEFDKVISKGKYLVDFSATWCGPCRMLEPVLEEVSKTYDVLQIDVDEQTDLATRFGVMSIPTLIVFKDGKEMTKSIGYVNEDEINMLMKNN